MEKLIREATKEGRGSEELEFEGNRATHTGMIRPE